jgi:hypothetical protein
MVTVEEKVICVWIAEFMSVTAVKRRLTAHYRIDIPHTNSVNTSIKTVKKTGSVNHKPRSGRPRISEQTVIVVQQAFETRPQKPVWRASAEVHVPQARAHKILKLKLHEHAYKIQVVQMLQKEGYHARLDFSQQIRSKITEPHLLLQELTFSDEANFHISDKVNESIWEGRNLDWSGNMKETPKSNFWWALRKTCIIGPFLFNEVTVNCVPYRVILLHFLIPELRQSTLLYSTFFHQDGTPCLYALNVRLLLNDVFPRKVDRYSWTNCLDTSFACSDPNGLLYVGSC